MMHSANDLTKSHRQSVAVIGPAECEPFVMTMAEDIGRGLASMGVIVITGGLGGVMESACKGAKEAGGFTVGVLPGTDRSQCNPYVDAAVLTGAGEMRNFMVVQSAAVVVAVGPGYGTLSEIAIALKMNKRVIGLATWEIPGVQNVTAPEEALGYVAEELAELLLKP